MPKFKVSPVLRHRNCHQSIRARLNRQLTLRLMQSRRHLILHPRYQKSIEHRPSIPTIRFSQWSA
jgi:hypothetical protein